MTTEKVDPRETMIGKLIVNEHPGDTAWSIQLVEDGSVIGECVAQQYGNSPVEWARELAAAWNTRALSAPPAATAPGEVVCVTEEMVEAGVLCAEDDHAVMTALGFDFFVDVYRAMHAAAPAHPSALPHRPEPSAEDIDQSPTDYDDGGPDPDADLPTAEDVRGILAQPSTEEKE